MSRSWQTALPKNYAEEKQKMLRKRYGGKAGEALRAFVPKVWPGVPDSVFLGFTAFSMSMSENTTEAVSNQRFHEIGLFQVEAGLRDKPAPDPDPSGEYNNWGRLHDNSLVVELLGREAKMGHDEWKTAPEDQVAVGLVNLRKKLDSLNSKLPETVRAKDLTSTWAVLLAFTAFSRGGGQTLRCLRPYAEKLADFPENERWATFEHMVAYDIMKSVDSIGNEDGRGGAPWAIMRSRQKFDSGKLFAAENGQDTNWYGSIGTDRDRDLVIVKKAYNVR